MIDRNNRNHKWGEAIAKEMKSLDKLNAFIYHAPTKQFSKSDGWKYAPLHMIYSVKAEDGRYKARLVAGGHVVDSSNYTTYSSTVEGLSIRLLRLIARQQGLSIMTGDIGNAFIAAPCKERIWTRAGPEFGDKEGSVIEFNKALYGLSTSPKAFHDFLGDTLRNMGFTPSRADQDIWYKQSSHYDGYDYIGVHDDDIMIAAKRRGEYMDMIEKQFNIRNKTDSPDYYLGNDQTIRKGKPHISCKKYILEALRSYQAKHGCLKKELIPM